MKYLARSDMFPNQVSEPFQAWAYNFGVCLHAHAIPYLKWGPVPQKTMRHLERSLKAASQAPGYVCEGPSTCTPIDPLPLWHSSIFQKGNHLTYSRPSLIKLGVLTVGDLFKQARVPRHMLLTIMGPTGVSVDQQGIGWVKEISQAD